jgi:hypothetical protein
MGGRGGSRLAGERVWRGLEGEKEVGKSMGGEVGLGSRRVGRRVRSVLGLRREVSALVFVMRFDVLFSFGALRV